MPSIWRCSLLSYVDLKEWSSRWVFTPVILGTSWANNRWKLLSLSWKVIQCGVPLPGAPWWDTPGSSLWSSLWPQKHLVRHLTSLMILLQSQDKLYSPQETFFFFLLAQLRRFWHPIRLWHFQACYIGEVELVTMYIFMKYETFAFWVVLPAKSCVLCTISYIISSIALEKEDGEKVIPRQVHEWGILQPDEWRAGGQRVDGFLQLWKQSDHGHWGAFDGLALLK